MNANERLDAIEARAKAPSSLGYAFTDYRTDVLALVAALRGVLKVHEPTWRLGVGHFCKRCSVVLTDDAPDCPTIDTITAALTEVTR